jgi:hypothetical protein
MFARKVYQLAKELNVERNAVSDYCKELGFEVKNPRSALTEDQVAAVTVRADLGPKDGKWRDDPGY